MKKVLKLDSRRRITLPTANPGDSYEISVLNTGQIMLTPVEIVPKRFIKDAHIAETDQKVRIIIPID